MRKLTFRGFTEQYVKQLSLGGSASIYRLVREAVSSNPRLKEPLLLYAVSNGKENVLLQASVGTACYAEYNKLLANFGASGLLEALKNGSPELPYEYHKVWQSYLSISQGYERDKRVKSLMRSKIRQLQTDTGVTTYQICKELGLNTSNVNSWLKNGLSSKISLKKARAVWEYLEQQSVTRNNGAMR